MGFLTAAKTIIDLLPTIIKAVIAVEGILTGAGLGTAKLAYVRQVLESVDHFVGGDDINALWPLIERVVSATVAMFNTVGWPGTAA